MGFSLSVLVARGFRTVFGSRVLSSAMLAKIDGKAVGGLFAPITDGHVGQILA